MAPRPYTLVAELTWRCPLRCVYCSNPVAYAKDEQELSTEVWSRAFEEAAALGVVQLHLSGGEPALRKDLVPLVRAARASELYTNLITGGTLLDPVLLGELKAAGLDHIQLSLQDSEKDGARWAAGAEVHDRKLEAAAAIRAAGFPLTLNVVLHRGNIGHVDALIAIALELGASRLELANTQFYAWALENRSALLPTRAETEAAEAVVRTARANKKLEIAYVKPDYFAGEPKPCMGGWAKTYMLITPSGEVLPCHAATVIPGLEFDRIGGAKTLDQIWATSKGLLAFRGDTWMEEPCRSCERKDIDFGGCRCQAFLLAGRATAADPACHRSADHPVVLGALERNEAKELVYRDKRSSLRLAR
jgi:pyrroloquinoline quinone biosynthesis protein E